VSIPLQYPGGYVNYATWAFDVDAPWASTNFSSDIAIGTTPSIFGAVVYAPNADQSLAVTISSIATVGAPSPIPAASIEFTVFQNGTANTFSEPFGPVNHTVMSLETPIGPYPGASIRFNISAWLPWEGGVIDRIVSPVYAFTWSPDGGWWHPFDGLLANLEVGTSPAVSVLGSAGDDPPLATLATDQDVNISIHEPVENVTIASAVINFVYTDSNLNETGTIPMVAASANTSFGILPGLPPGTSVSFYLVAKDINGNVVSSGNFSYTEVGPTAPPLPSDRGLVFVEALDLSTGSLLAGIPYTLANDTWSYSGKGTALGFGSPLLPGTSQAYPLYFGTYSVAATVLGNVESGIVTLSPDDPTPIVVFYAESSPATVLPSSQIPIDSFLSGAGLIAAAVVTLPLLLWLEERREAHEREQRRITI
jgi:hypothetical protein